MMKDSDNGATMKDTSDNASDDIETGELETSTGTTCSITGRSSPFKCAPAQISKCVGKVYTKAIIKVFGDSYSERECGFVLLAGALIAFNSGFINESCVSGFLTPTRTQSVAGYSSFPTLY